MAIIYCWNSGSNTSPYDTWAKAATTINTALGAWGTGDVIYVAKDHTEGTAAITLSTVGSTAEPIPIYTVDRADDSYAVATAKTLNSSDAGADITGSNVDAAFHGLHFFCDDNTVWQSSRFYDFVDCKLETHSASARHYLGNTGGTSFIRFTNCTFTESDGTYNMWIYATCLFTGCTFSGDIVTSGLFSIEEGNSVVTFVGCDFSGITTSTILVDTSGASTTDIAQTRLINCEIPDGMAITDGTIRRDGQSVEAIATDSAGGLYRYEFHGYRGTITTQTGDLYRTSGYSDADGDTSASHKIVPASTLERATNVKGPMLTQYVSTTGAKTVEVHAADTFTTAPNKNQLFIEVFYLNAAGETLFTLGSSRDANILATTALTTTTSEWTDGSAVLTHEYKMSATVTVNQAGYIGVRVVLEGDQTAETAKALYYDPKIEIS